jgi:thiol-disulfide isomerase/thioredoxin
MGSHHLLGRVKSICPHFGKTRIAGGVLIMLTGFWMLHNQISLLRAESDMPPPEVSQSSISSPVYERSLPGLDREAASLAQLRGKTVYIKFWTTWCPLCLAGLEDFAALAEQAASSPDIAVISIVTPGLNGEIPKEDFIAWARAQRLSFPIYFDESGTVTREFGIRAYPTAAYLSANGDVLKKIVGDESNAQILGEMNSLKGK